MSFFLMISSKIIYNTHSFLFYFVPWNCFEMLKCLNQHKFLYIHIEIDNDVTELKKLLGFFVFYTECPFLQNEHNPATHKIGLI